MTKRVDKTLVLLLLTLIVLNAIDGNRPGGIETSVLKGVWGLHTNDRRLVSRVNLTAGGWDSYSSLWQAGLLPSDPLQDFNDETFRWVANVNWTLQHSFKMDWVDPSSRIYLEWTGIDVFCRLYLNKRLIGRLGNSFATYIWRVDRILMSQGNNLVLQCSSTPEMAKQLATKLTAQGKFVPPPTCWPPNFHGECHINLVRTTQASFGWDWGPALPIQGFWQLPKLLIQKGPINARFGQGFKFYPRSDGRMQKWSADGVVEVLANLQSPDDEFCLEWKFEQLPRSERTRCFKFQSTRSRIIDVRLELLSAYEGIVPWWPAGMASGPKLYDLLLKLTTKGRRVLDQRLYQVGFRYIELIQNPVSSTNPRQGLTFYFRINGVPFFTKGANWIPSRLLPGRQSGFMKPTKSKDNTDDAQVTESLFKSALAAGIHLLRIWGGGRYEPDSFYESADRLGLMIWHDLMFAVSTYAERDNVTGYDAVELEVKQQIRRLHWHPSIIVWATDNEVKQAVWSGWYGFSQKLIANFKSRFFDSLYHVVGEEERIPSSVIIGNSTYRRRPCLISSPSNGIKTQRANGTDRYPQNPHYGDIHFYVYSGALWNELAYPLSRFTSEFGLQSLPSVLAWKRAMSRPDNASQWDVRGALMRHRQHHTIGLSLLDLAASFTGKPQTTSDYVENYRRWAYATQLNQLMSLKVHINKLIRHQCRLEGGDRPTDWTSMGAVYWQLNDIWAAPSWSTIDAAGQWKMAHYGAIRETFTQLGHVVLTINGRSVEADWIPASLQLIKPRPRSFLVTCHTIDSFDVVSQWNLTIQATRGQQLSKFCPIKLMKMTLDEVKQKCRLPSQLNSAKYLIQIRPNSFRGDQMTNPCPQDGAFQLFGLPSEIPKWPVSDIRIVNFHECRPNPQTLARLHFQPHETFCFNLLLQAPQLFIWLELDPYITVDNYWFEQNAFNVVSCNRTRQLRLYTSGTSKTTNASIVNSIRITSLATIREKNIKQKK